MWTCSEEGLVDSPEFSGANRSNILRFAEKHRLLALADPGALAQAPHRMASEPTITPSLPLTVTFQSQHKLSRQTSPT